MNQGSFLDQISVTELLKLASKIKMLAYVIFKLSKVLSEDFSWIPQFFRKPSAPDDEIRFITNDLKLD